VRVVTVFSIGSKGCPFGLVGYVMLCYVSRLTYFRLAVCLGAGIGLSTRSAATSIPSKSLVLYGDWQAACRLDCYYRLQINPGTAESS
jgi:hypothetical protein